MIAASASFQLGPVDAGRYQLRGFYDRDDNFHAAVRYANLATLGDVGGGAIANTISLRTFISR